MNDRIYSRWILRAIHMIAVASVMAVAGVSTNAQEPAKPAAPTGVAGKWTMSVNGQDGVITAGLALTQDGRKVTGTLTSDQTGEVPLAGEFADGTLTFSVTVHTDSDAMRVDFTGKLKDDGTLAGSLTGPMGDMTWTATRVKQ